MSRKLLSTILVLWIAIVVTTYVARIPITNSAIVPDISSNNSHGESIDIVIEITEPSDAPTGQQSDASFDMSSTGSVEQSEESSIEASETDEPTYPTIDLTDITGDDFFFGVEEQDKGSSGFCYAFYRIDGQKFAGENMNKKFFSACTIKIPYCYYLCTLIDDNPELADKQLTYTKDCYHGGSGKIQYSSYGTKYTIKELINLCLSISDNVAYKMLHKEFGIEGYNNFIGEGNLQLKGSRLWADLTVMDLVKVWTRVYHYFEEETIGSKLLKESCTNTKFAYGVLTLDTEYSHKSGDSFDDPGEYHDAGIIWNGDNSYVFVFLTNGSHNKSKVNSLAEWAFNEMTIMED